MKFINKKHQKNYQKLTNLFSKFSTSKHYLLLYIMAGNKELEAKMKNYLDEHTVVFAYERMLHAEKLSAETLTLAKIAINIYQGRNDFKATQLFHLNEANFDLAINTCEYSLRSYGESEQLPFDHVDSF